MDLLLSLQFKSPKNNSKTTSQNKTLAFVIHCVPVDVTPKYNSYTTYIVNCPFQLQSSSQLCCKFQQYFLTVSEIQKSAILYHKTKVYIMGKLFTSIQRVLKLAHTHAVSHVAVEQLAPWFCGPSDATRRDFDETLFNAVDNVDSGTLDLSLWQAPDPVVAITTVGWKQVYVESLRQILHCITRSMNRSIVLLKSGRVTSCGTDGCQKLVTE